MGALSVVWCAAIHLKTWKIANNIDSEYMGERNSANGLVNVRRGVLKSRYIRRSFSLVRVERFASANVKNCQVLFLLRS